jgi:CRP/FNR family transcriptional regulator
VSIAFARLYDVLEELAGNTFASVRQRVARHLLDLATSRLEASRTLTALVNQQDLANSVGSVREVVARVLAELRSEHLVRTSPGRVEILDPVRMSHELWSRARDESHSPEKQGQLMGLRLKGICSLSTMPPPRF